MFEFFKNLCGSPVNSFDKKSEKPNKIMPSSETKVEDRKRGRTVHAFIQPSPRAAANKPIVVEDFKSIPSFHGITIKVINNVSCLVLSFQTQQAASTVAKLAGLKNPGRLVEKDDFIEKDRVKPNQYNQIELTADNFGRIFSDGMKLQCPILIDSIKELLNTPTQSQYWGLGDNKVNSKVNEKLLKLAEALSIYIQLGKKGKLTTTLNKNDLSTDALVDTFLQKGKTALQVAPVLSPTKK